MPAIKTIQQQQYQRKVYNVAELNRRCKQVLESELGTIWLEAEISNFARPASGHWYFTLKDSKAQIRSAMFRGNNSACKVIPAEGMKVLIRGRVSLFEPRGDYQLIVEYLEEAGAGELLRKYEELKKRLEQEGLFDSLHKKELKNSYKRFGIITSATGAAVHDILSVIRRRYPLQEVVIYPCLVQGEQATAQIINQIKRANERIETDILILARGGGSLEDLWCFNDETLARTIFESELPIVTGIGHETDFTIADFVADYRAPTPSAAAEKITPDIIELFDQISAIKYWLINQIQNRLQNQNQKLDWLTKQLQSPKSVIVHRSQQLELLLHRMLATCKSLHYTKVQQLQNLKLRLNQEDPSLKVNLARQRHQQLKKRLKTAINSNVRVQIARFKQLTSQLEAYSPLATINRGYSVTRTPEGNVITDINQLKQGQTLLTSVSNGSIESKVTKLNKESLPS